MPAILASQIGTNKPIYGPNGIITGYGRSYGAANAAENPNSVDYPIADATGGFISNITGLPWPKGAPLMPMTLGQKKTFAPATPGARSYGTETGSTGKQPWELIVTPKMPELNTQIAGLEKAQGGVTQDWQKTFKQLQQEELASLKTQNQKTGAALDTGALSAELRGENKRYEGEARTYLDDSAASNADYAKKTAELLAQNRANTEAMVTGLDEQLTAAQSAAAARVKAYQAGSGTPTSSGGAVSNRFIRETTPSRLAYLQNVGQLRRADVGVEQAAARELYGNDRAQGALKNALDNQFRGNNTETARYLYEVTARAEQLQGAQLTDYLNQVIRVMGLGQSLIANDANNLSMLARLKLLTNDYTYRGDYSGANVPATPNWTPQAPRRNYQTGGDFVPSLTAPPVGGSTRGPKRWEDMTDAERRPLWNTNGGHSYAPRPDYVREGVPVSPMQYEGGGVFDVPNDYNWMRTDTENKRFQELQRSYE